MNTTKQLTDSMFYIMAALTKPRHGYAIMNLIEERTDGAISIGPASMYTIIKKLLGSVGTGPVTHILFLKID